MSLNEQAVNSAAKLATLLRGRRWRFSLRSALVIVLLFAVAFAAFGWRMRQAQRQAAIVEKIRATGAADVLYDYKPRATMIPQWACDWLGEDFFYDVIGVAIGPAEVSVYDIMKQKLDPPSTSTFQVGEALAVTEPLPKIRMLMIHHAVVRREALEQFAGWERLTYVVIESCDVGDDDLMPLARAVNVRSISLRRQPIGDRALVHLRQMSQLRVLSLEETNVTDEGLSELSNFPHLRELSLHKAASVSDRGMVSVGSCGELQYLDLAGTAVGNEGVREAANLKDLHFLNLCKSRVTDEGLRHLATLTKLEEGLFRGTSVTQAGIDQIPSLVKSKGYRIDQSAKSAEVTAGSTVDQ